MKELKLSNSHLFAIIDDEDFERCIGRTWFYQSTSGYVYCTVYEKLGYRRYKNKTVYLHNFISGKSKQDHINRNKLDCRKENLRDASNSQNCINTEKRVNQFTTSKYKGVAFHPRDKIWQACIMKEYKSIYIGSYKTEREAALAYNLKAKELFGEFAVLNSL